MQRLEVEFIGGDFNRAAKSIIAEVFNDPEFMAPGSVPLWGAGGPEGDDTDCTGFLYMPRRPFSWLIKKHGLYTFANEQLGLTERDESTHYPVFKHLWATYLPGGRRLLKATTKNERKRQRRRDKDTAHEADQTASTASAGKLLPASHDVRDELFEVEAFVFSVVIPSNVRAPRRVIV